MIHLLLLIINLRPLSGAYKRIEEEFTKKIFISSIQEVYSIKFGNLNEHQVDNISFCELKESFLKEISSFEQNKYCIPIYKVNGKKEELVDLYVRTLTTNLKHHIILNTNKFLRNKVDGTIYPLITSILNEDYYFISFLSEYFLSFYNPVFYKIANSKIDQLFENKIKDMYFYDVYNEYQKIQFESYGLIHFIPNIIFNIIYMLLEGNKCLLYTIIHSKKDPFFNCSKNTIFDKRQKCLFDIVRKYNKEVKGYSPYCISNQRILFFCRYFEHMKSFNNLVISDNLINWVLFLKEVSLKKRLDNMDILDNEMVVKSVYLAYCRVQNKTPRNYNNLFNSNSYLYTNVNLSKFDELLNEIIRKDSKNKILYISINYIGFIFEAIKEGDEDIFRIADEIFIKKIKKFQSIIQKYSDQIKKGEENYRIFFELPSQIIDIENFFHISTKFLNCDFWRYKTNGMVSNILNKVNAKISDYNMNLNDAMLVFNNKHCLVIFVFEDLFINENKIIKSLKVKRSIWEIFK